MIRFLRMYESGSGDYTAERAELLKKETIASIVRRVKTRSRGTGRIKSSPP